MPLGSQVGGAEALLGHLLRHSPHTYEYVCVFLQDGPLVEEVNKLGYHTTVLPTSRLMDLRNYLKITRMLRRWIKANDVQAVVSWMSKGQLYTGVAALALPVKTMWFQHSIPMGLALWDRLVTILPVSAVLCCSETTQVGQDHLFPKKDSYVCYPGVSAPSINQLSMASARRTLNLSNRGPIVGMVARLERWKGAHIFVEAATAILHENPTATMFIVGGPHWLDLKYAEELHEMVKTRGLGERFMMVGQQTMASTLIWQASADIIVHPVTGIEPFGMAVVEAMSLGKVVVTSNQGGPAEIIQDGCNGVLIESNDSGLLAATVTSLLAHPSKCRAIEQEAYIRGRHFSVETFSSRFEEIVTQVLNLDRT